MMSSNPAGVFSAVSSFLKPTLFLITMGMLVSGCHRAPEPTRETRFMMGTLVEVVVYAQGDAASDAVNRAFTRIHEVEKASSRWEKGSALESIRAGKGASLGADETAIMKTALSVAVASSGAFDPTLGELVELWGIGTDQPRVPEEEEISGALERSGYRKIPEEGCCPPGVKVWLDLGGVAKGYAVDEAVKVLKGEGISAGIVDAGGDLRSFGQKPGDVPWKIGVQDPETPQELAGILDVGEVSVATSGDYQRFFEAGGIRYHHILDSKTGRPARSGVKSATVLAPGCALADALATAAFVMGPERGLGLLEEWEGVEGILISDDGVYHVTSGIGKEYPFEKR